VYDLKRSTSIQRYQGGLRVSRRDISSGKKTERELGSDRVRWSRAPQILAKQSNFQVETYRNGECEKTLIR
jgi:hypothetical protein